MSELFSVLNNLKIISEIHFSKVFFLLRTVSASNGLQRFSTASCAVIWISLYYECDLMVFSGRRFHRLEVLKHIIYTQTMAWKITSEVPTGLPTQWSPGTSFQSNTAMLFAMQNHVDGFLCLRHSHYMRSCVLMWFFERNKQN